MNRWMRFEIWVQGLIAAAISGGANGVVSGLGGSALGMPLHDAMKLAAASAIIGTITGVAMRLQKSPLPELDQPAGPPASLPLPPEGP